MVLGRTNCLSGSIFRPRIQFTAIGIPYAISNITTEAETMALKALDEPRKMHPNMITRTTVKYNAFSGTLSFGWTWEKNGDAGRPPSLFLLVLLWSRGVVRWWVTLRRRKPSDYSSS